MQRQCYVAQATLLGQSRIRKSRVSCFGAVTGVCVDIDVVTVAGQGGLLVACYSHWISSRDRLLLLLLWRYDPGRALFDWFGLCGAT